MRFSQESALTTPDKIRSDLCRRLERLQWMIRRNQDVLEELQHLREHLDSLPLASGEYGTAANRLRNAHRYLVSEERGAARYELQMLASSLKSVETRDAGPRMRRHRTVPNR